MYIMASKIDSALSNHSISHSLTLQKADPLKTAYIVTNPLIHRYL